MITFDITSCIDKFYPYRTAILEASILITLNDKDKQYLGKYLQHMGYKLDNHICWKNSDDVCFSYSDGKLGVGLRIIEAKY